VSRLKISARRLNPCPMLARQYPAGSSWRIQTRIITGTGQTTALLCKATSCELIYILDIHSIIVNPISLTIIQTECDNYRVNTPSVTFLCVRWQILKENTQIHAFLEQTPRLDTPSAKDAAKRRRNGLPDYRLDRERSQGGGQDADGNRTAGAVQSGEGTHSLTCGYREQIWYTVSTTPFRLRETAV